MKNIKTVDLWTEQMPNQFECFNGAFVDGFDKGSKPFDEYKIIRNCNCLITTSIKNINISNKHNAIVFYKNKKPVRLIVINKDTDIDNCINIALSQKFQSEKLIDFYHDYNIVFNSINLKEQPKYNENQTFNEIDVGSCDRWNLLYNLLKGSYTESKTSYGNYENDQYEFIPDINIKYELNTGKENFKIEHKCAFINALKTRIIIIQENSPLTRKGD